jgi:hypothetical protein
VERNTLEEKKPNLGFNGGSLKGRKVKRHPLDTVEGLLGETLRVYRAMKADTLDIDKGKALVWVLMAARAMVEARGLARIEERLRKMGATAEQRGLLTYDGNGHDTTPTRLDG